MGTGEWGGLKVFGGAGGLGEVGREVVRGRDVGLRRSLRIIKRWYLRTSPFTALIITLYMMYIFIVQFYAMQFIYMMLHNILLL